MRIRLAHFISAAAIGALAALSSPVRAKTLKECNAEYAANKAAIQGGGQKQADFIKACRAGREKIPARSAAPAPVIAAPKPAGPADSQRLADMRGLKLALTKYYGDKKSYPATPAGDQCSGNYNNVVNLSSSLVPNYISVIPKDPKPRSCEYNYQYIATPDGQNYVIMVNLDDIDPATYPDHWCIGLSSGAVAPYDTTYRACP